MADTEHVYYRGGSSDGVFIANTPQLFHTHPQRELGGRDPEAPYELYRRTSEQDVTAVVAGDDGEPVEQQVRAVVYEFAGAAATRRLDDDMDPLPGGAGGPASS